jgi:hypothetical protein
VTARIGSIFHRTDGGAGTSFYIKESGTGNTGWTAIGSAGSGTVTSVAQTVPTDIFAVSGSPVTTSGTLALTKVNQAANKFLAGPVSGADAAYVFRLMELSDLPVGPSVRLAKSANQSISHDTVTALTWDAETWDTDNFHDNSTNNNRLVCPSAGKFAMMGFVQWEYNATGQRQLIIRNSGGGYEAHSQNVTADQVHQFVFTMIVGAASDWFEMVVYQTSGISLNIQNAMASFIMWRVSK